jgi:hypothetical protein
VGPAGGVSVVRDALRAGLVGMALAAVAWAMPAGLSAGADVVVLCGLPGDVETEKAYQDQIGRLLRILAEGPTRPRRLVVLSDAPSGITKPAGLDAELMPATRENLLAVATQLSARADAPLLVFAWGHGGAQGAIPVFHVRGPRIVAEDLASLAKGRSASRWLLFFRGSGAFAGTLRGVGAQILASERATAFRSDPIGFSLVLRLLERDGSLDLQALAARLGQATATWYEERKLARQEEPTLWREAAEPEALLRAGDAGAADEESEAPAPTVAARAASEDWKHIVRVDPARHPEADAVVLSSRVTYTIGDNPALSGDSDTFIQVLTAEGKRYGDFDLSYVRPFEALTLLDCEVMLPDGSLERLDPESVQDARSMLRESSEARKIFSLPHVVPGAIVRVHAQREWKRFPLPHVFLEVPLAGDALVLRSEVQVRVGLKAALHFALREAPEQKPQLEETRYGRAYTWRFENLEPPRHEALAPPERSPTLLVSTFPDWAAFGSWYRGLILEADRVTPEITATAAELTRGAQSEREKVVALYNYVTKLRYVAVPLGVNSHRPHAAANVLKNRYGDCKDKANLFNALLKAVGITADLVLVPRFRQAYDATPGLAFNHAISRVRLGGDVIWADTTDDVARFGLLPPGDPGRKVLVIDGSTSLTELPLPEPAGHAISLDTRIGAAGDTIVVEAHATGYADYQLRAAARQTAQSGQPVLAEDLRLAAGAFSLSGQSHTALEALDRDFEWRGEGRLDGLVVTLPEGRGRLLRAPFWLPREWELAAHQRRAPLLLNQGYPLLLKQRVEWTLPDSSHVALPAVASGGGLPLRWRLEWRQQSPTRLTAQLEIELARGELALRETAAFQDQLRMLQAALASGPVVAAN